MPDPDQGRAAGFLRHSGDERGRVPEDPILETPTEARRLPGAQAVAAQVRQPHVEAARAQEIRQPAIARAAVAQPHRVPGKGAVHEQDRRAAVAVRAHAVQGDLHTVGRGDAAGQGHAYTPARLYDASSSSTGCTAGMDTPAARRPAPLFMPNPGLPVATASGAAARSASSFGASTPRESAGPASGSLPAPPRHCAAP